jgi:hypothetical protein
VRFSSGVDEAGEIHQLTFRGFPMSDNGDSTFNRPRPLSTTGIESHCNADEPIDLVKFMGVAQRLGVRFLPITWQETRDSIGRGATSTISQAIVNEDTSFSFKRIADRDKCHESEDTIFQRLIREIVVLRHGQFRILSLYFAQLQGLCWEVVPTSSVHERKDEGITCVSVDKIWPVLVLEAAPYGDLYSFLRSPVGQTLSAVDRLDMCHLIGLAIKELHKYSKFKERPLIIPMRLIFPRLSARRH